MHPVDPITGLVERPPPRAYPFGSSLITDLPADPVSGDPRHLALVDGDRTWNHRELSSAFDHARAALHALGVGPGDRVAWTLPNCAELPIGFVATMLRSAVWLGINEPLAPPEKQYLLDDAGVSVYIATAEVLDTLGDPPPGRRHVTFDQWRALIDSVDPREGYIEEHDPHAPAAIAYTSGTTGRPKGAVHSQHNLMWPGLVTCRTHPPKPTDRQGTPLAHTILNMMVLGVISAWARGTTGVILHSTRAEKFAAEVARHRVTRTTIVPTMAHDLIERDIDPARLASLDSVIVGGAACPADVRRRFHERFGVRAIAGYGLSEAPSGIVRESLDEPISETTAGYPMEPFTLSIRDDDGAELPVGDEGEICVAATDEGEWAGCWTPMLGYWRRPDATAAALAGGVLHTGDIGSLDTEGRLTISGRRSDLILRGGANVYPAEVENVLLGHPTIVEASVYGIPDARLGERVAAAVVVAAPLDEAAVREHCAAALAAYKIPDRFVVVDALPRNAMGKVVRSALPGADAGSRSGQ